MMPRQMWLPVAALSLFLGSEYALAFGNPPRGIPCDACINEFQRAGGCTVLNANARPPPRLALASYSTAVHVSSLR